MPEKCSTCAELVAEIWNWCPICGCKRHPLADEAHSFPTESANFKIGNYRTARAQVFEVVVRQALTGSPWQLICSGPMSSNNITKEEVEQEVLRRMRVVARKTLSKPAGVFLLPDVRRRIFALCDFLDQLRDDPDIEEIDKFATELLVAADELSECLLRVPFDEQSNLARSSLQTAQLAMQSVLLGSDRLTPMSAQLAVVVNQLLDGSLRLPVYQNFHAKAAEGSAN